MRKEIIRLDRLTVEDHGYNYLSNVSFYVEENEIVGILGQFNSGRRELAEIICGIRTWIDPHIYISEKQQTKWDKKIAVSNGIFYIKDIKELFENGDVAFNVYLLRQKDDSHWVDARKYREKCDSLLQELKIPLYAEMKIDKLTYIEKIMVMIARSVVAGAKVIVFDNIISTLNEIQISTFSKLLYMLKERGISLVLVDGDIDVLMKMTERIVVVRNGRIVSNSIKEQYDEERFLVLMIGHGVELDFATCPQIYREETKQHFIIIESGKGFGTPLLYVKKGSMTGIVVDSEENVLQVERIFCGEDKRYHFLINGKLIRNRNVRDYLGVVREHSVIFPNLNIEENIAINYQRKSSRILHIRKSKIKIALNNQVKRIFRPYLERISQVDSISELARSDRKIVEISRELISNPEIMVYINPVYRLGNVSSKFILKKIMEIHETGRTSVLVSDNIHVCSAICDTVILLRNNKVIGAFDNKNGDIPYLVDYYQLHYVNDDNIGKYKGLSGNR